MEKMGRQKNTESELSKITKENPFKVPENYFDDFYSRLHIRLEEKEMALPEKKHKIIRLFKPALGLAASFILIFMLVYWPVKTFVRNGEEGLTVEMSDIEYFSVIDKVDENTFFDLLEESDKSNEFSDEDLESYLSANVSDYEIYLATGY